MGRMRPPSWQRSQAASARTCWESALDFLEIIRRSCRGLSHAPEELKPDVDRIDAPCGDIDVGRIRTVRERAHEQTVMTGRECVKDKTSEAVGRRGGVW